MKRIYLLSLFLFSIICVSYSQVETHHYNKGEIVKGLRKSMLLNRAVIQMPTFDLSKELEESRKKQEEGVFLFGKGFDVSYSLSDGQWEDTDGGRLWTMTIVSEGALSLNFVLNNFYLPEGAELYVENLDGTVVFGPVTHETITEDGFYLTDIIPGEQATISLFEPSNVANQSFLEIKRVVHGYKNANSDMKESRTRSEYWGKVYEYPAFETETDAVGLVLTPDGNKLCLGSLMMSTDYSFKPYFLMTLNYIAVDNDGEITESGKYYATHCMFKFRSKHVNNSAYATSYTYNQAYFRSSWGTTKFLLLELMGNVASNTHLTWLGWERSSTPATSETFFYNMNNSNNEMMLEHINSTLSDNTTNWYVDRGSYYNTNLIFAGAPMIDQNKRLVGHLYNFPLNSPLIAINKFYLSWYGGGTYATQLKHWLDPTNTTNTQMNSFRSMAIEGASQIITSRTYKIKNLPSSSSFTVTWQLTDSYYNSVIQNNTPSTNQCTITRNSAHSMSNATLEARVYFNGTLIGTYTKLVSTGSGFDGTYYNGVTTKPLDYPSPLDVLSGSTIVINSPNLVGATASIYGGTITSSTYWNLNSTTGVLQIGMPSSEGIMVVKVVSADNSNYYLQINAKFDSGILMTVSQSEGIVAVSLLPENRTESRGEKASFSLAPEWILEVRNAITGEKVFNQKVTGASYEINTTGWKSGVYAVRAIIGKETKTEKVIVK